MAHNHTSGVSTDRRPQLGNSAGIPKFGRRDLIIILMILFASILFKIIFLPTDNFPPYALIMTPDITSRVRDIFTHDWTRLLLPYRYEPGRYYWCTSIIPFTYAAQIFVGPIFSYLFFSSLLVAVSFFVSRSVRCSRVLAATAAFMFAFGTQLDYLFTYGNLIALYLVLTYIAVNFGIALYLGTQTRSNRTWQAAFVVTLVIVALSNEMWLNYATALVSASLFGIAWARHHSLPHYFRACRFVLVATLAVLGVYLLIRMQYVDEYLLPGSEEELLVTYHSVFLIFDDFLTNFFTLLYMSLSNYLPSFVIASNSLTYLPHSYILAEQHGYDTSHQQLILMSQLFLWRFYAGVTATFFGGFLIWAIVNAWRSASLHFALLTALALMVLTGFPTHLAIKMRPYNAAPALPYKVIISVTACTALIAYLVDLYHERLQHPWARRTLVVAVWSCVFLAALTRPHMQAELLSEVGLVGAGDPLGRILHWFH